MGWLDPWRICSSYSIFAPLSVTVMTLSLMVWSMTFMPAIQSAFVLDIRKEISASAASSSSKVKVMVLPAVPKLPTDLPPLAISTVSMKELP